MIVLMWGGLRGAVGICLALQIYEDGDLCSDLTIGPKVLVYISIAHTSIVYYNTVIFAFNFLLSAEVDIVSHCWDCYADISN